MALKGQGKSFKYGMPVYGLEWPKGETIFICGGGGNGIKNRLVCASVTPQGLTDQIAEFLFGDDCPMRMAISPNEKSMVFAMGKGGIRRVDLDNSGKVPKFTEISGELLERVSNIKGEVKCLTFKPSGSHLAIGFDSGELHVYEWPSLKLKFCLNGENKRAEAVRDVDFFPSGVSEPAGSHLLAITIDNGTCEVWDWAKSRMLCRLEPGKLKQKLERTILLSNDGKTLVQRLPAGIERIKISKLRFAKDGSGDLLTMLNTPVSGAYVAKWSGAASLLVSGADGGMGTAVPSTASASAATPPSASGQTPLLSLVSCNKVSERPCTCFDVSQDGRLLAFGTSEGGVVVRADVRAAFLGLGKLELFHYRVTLASSGTKPVFKLLKAHMVFVTGITFSKDTKHVLSASADASARLTDISPGSLRIATKGEGGQPELARIVLIIVIILCFIAACTLQTVRVLKQQYGMTTQEIEALILGWMGLRHKDEL